MARTNHTLPAEYSNATEIRCTAVGISFMHGSCRVHLKDIEPLTATREFVKRNILLNQLLYTYSIQGELGDTRNVPPSEHSYTCGHDLSHAGT